MSNKKAFTLIELLVVIAIIALLLAIITPALKKSREISRQVVCASNMHQWAVGTRTYCVDNNDEFPLRFSPDGQRNHNGLMFYYVNYTPGLKSATQPRIDLLSIFVEPYLGESNVADCPGRPNKVDDWEKQKRDTASTGHELVSGDYGLYVGYDINLSGIYWGPGPNFNFDPMAVDAFVPPIKSSKAPPGMPVAGCLVYNYYTDYGSRPAGTWYYYHYNSDDGASEPKGAPTAFNDGSAEFVKYDNMVIYQKYSSGIGVPLEFWWRNPKR